MGEKAFAKRRKIPTRLTGFQRFIDGEGSALTENTKGELEMTYADRFEQMPFVEKMFIAFIGMVVMSLAGLVAMTLVLVILKIAIGGIC